MDNLHLPIQPQTYTRLSDLTGFAPPKFYLATAHSYAPLLVAPTAKQYYLEPEPENELTGVGQKHLWPLLTASRDTSLIRAETQAQFCPLCLILGLYHRRIWSVTSVTICLVHKVLLISRCPGCKNSLTIGEVTLGRCRGCGAEVRAALPVFVGDDETGIILQTILQGWLDGSAQNALKLNLITPVNSGGKGENSLTLASNGTTSTKTEVASTPDINLNLALENRVKLPDQPAATLYATMEGLRKAIDLTTKETWPYRHKPVLTQPLLELEAVEAAFYSNYCRYTTAFKILADWPGSFYEFVDAYRDPHYRLDEFPTSPSRGVGSELGKLYRNWILREWQPSVYSFIHAAFEQYVLERYSLTHRIVYAPPQPTTLKLIRGKVFPYIDVVEAGKLLGLKPEQVEILIQADQLGGYTTRDIYSYGSSGKKCRWMVSRAEVMRYSRSGQVAECLRLLEIAKTAGVSDKGLFLWKMLHEHQEEVVPL